MTLSRSAARLAQIAYADPHSDSDSDSPRPSSRSRPLRSLFDPLPLQPAPPPAPSIDHSLKRGRLYPGTRIEDMYEDPFSAARPFDSFTSSFATSEYLAHLIRRDPTDLDLLTRLPTRVDIETEWHRRRRRRSGREGDAGVNYYEDGDEEEEEAVEVRIEVERPEVDPLVWTYEHLRKLVVGLQVWVAALEGQCRILNDDDDDNDGDTRDGRRGGDCAEMRASEWLYLCAAHKTPPTRPCTALSYIAHVLDGSSSLLTSTQYFPSRVSLVQDGGGDGDVDDGEALASDKGNSNGTKALLSTVSRRLYRCFSHTYFHHSKLFYELESETWLLRRFVKLNDLFGMIPHDDQGVMIIPDLDWDGDYYDNVNNGDDDDTNDLGSGRGGGGGGGGGGRVQDELKDEDDEARGGIRLVE